MTEQPTPDVDLNAIIEQSRRNTAGTDLASIGLKTLAVAAIVAANPGCKRSLPAGRRFSNEGYAAGATATIGMQAVSDAIAQGYITDEHGSLTVTEAGERELRSTREHLKSMKPGY